MMAVVLTIWKHSFTNRCCQFCDIEVFCWCRLVLWVCQLSISFNECWLPCWNKLITQADKINEKLYLLLHSDFFNFHPVTDTNCWLLITDKVMHLVIFNVCWWHILATDEIVYLLSQLLYAHLHYICALISCSDHMPCDNAQSTWFEVSFIHTFKTTRQCYVLLSYTDCDRVMLCFKQELRLMEAKLVAEKSAKIRDWVSHKVQEVITIAWWWINIYVT